MLTSMIGSVYVCGRSFLAVCLISACAQGQSLGTAPSERLGATDIYSAFRLPPFRDVGKDSLDETARPLQVINRAHSLGITSRTGVEAWLNAQSLLSQTEATATPARGSLSKFSGNAASALNRLLKTGTGSVRVVSGTLNVDEPIVITRDRVHLDLGSTRIKATRSMPYMLRIERAANVLVEGGNFLEGDSAILVNKSKDVTIKRALIQGLTGDGIVVTQTTRAVISQNTISALQGASILLHGGTASSVVERNEVTGNHGSSNMAAGIVVSDRNADLSLRAQMIFGPDGYWVVSEPMIRRLNAPHNNLIAFNHLAWNSATGIYIDGGIANVIASNVIEGNAKEGICLDNGATANVVASNTVVQNGSRWGESDLVMSRDSISGAGRLADGTPAAKVPGISVDNATYNLILSNNVQHNFGGGIKMVRTGYFNVVGLNTVVSNNDGASEKFHFFGIELGATPLDVPSDELDGAPSRGNIVFSNTVRGSHYAGIFFGAGSDHNDVFDNIIMDAQKWALESVQALPNSSLNNLTNLPSRNIGSGLSPDLLDAARTPN